MIEIIKNFFRGSVIGVAEIVPGVSGSTLALAMGIYDDVINFIHNILGWLKSKFIGVLAKFIARFGDLKLKEVKPHFEFGVPLVFGIVFINAVLANVISSLINTVPNYVQAVFFGLVIASVFVPWKEIKNKSLKNLIIILTVASITFMISGLKPSEIMLSPDPFYVFFVALVAIVAMLLPGVSGSFVFLIFGIYEYIIGIIRSLTRFDISGPQIYNLLAFCAGALISFSFFIKYVKIGFDKYPDTTYSILLGFIVGTLRLVFPFFEPVFENGKIVDRIPSSPFVSTDSYNVYVVILLIIAGFTFVKVAERFGSKKKK